MLNADRIKLASLILIKKKNSRTFEKTMGNETAAQMSNARTNRKTCFNKNAKKSFACKSVVGLKGATPKLDGCTFPVLGEIKGMWQD